MIIAAQRMTTLLLAVAVCILLLIRAPSEPFITPRVVGGVGTKTPPWFVLVAVKFSNATQFCGATLIAPDVVLTVGHCLRGPVSEVNVMIGYESPAQEIIKVERSVVHPKFTMIGDKSVPDADKTVIYDVALLFLTKSVDMTPIKRAAKNPAPGQNVTIIGNGNVKPWDTEVSDPKRVGPSQLQKAALLLTVVSNSDCKKEHDKRSKRDSVARLISQAVVSPSVLCTVSNTGVSICHGDSGGPMIDDKGRLVGANSFGSKGCGFGAKGAVYSMAASIPHVNDWIDSEIAKYKKMKAGA